MNPISNCGTCDTPLAPGLLGGLCPKCLRRLAFAAPTTGSNLPPESTPGNPSSHWQPPPASEVAALLPTGTYSVERLIGRGGMGAVYQGTQLRLKRQVAIKLMRQDHGTDEGFRLRFQREALLLASLDHPGIVKVIDCDVAGPDLLYIVMELVDGVNLMEVIRSGGVSEKRAIDIVGQVCAALGFAHNSGIVHRDIKPSNILISRDGRVRIADFGLATPIGPEGENTADSAIGTPSYAAPEQLRADGLVDQRADLYAVGVMIYQMLTGGLPHDGWKPPSQVVAVDPMWDRIVSKALQSKPQDRFSGAEAMQDLVSRISPVDPVGIRRRRRHRLWLAVALIALVAGGRLFWSPAEKAPSYPSPESWTDATPELHNAADLYDFGVLRQSSLEITEDAHVELANGREFQDVSLRVNYSGVVSLGLRGTRDEYYLATVRANGDAEITMGFLRPDVHPDFKPAVFQLGGSYDPTAQHEMVLSAQGGTIQMWLDGRLVTTLHDTILSSGRLALRAYATPDAPARITRLEYGPLGDAGPAPRRLPKPNPAPGTIAHRLTSSDFKWSAPTHLGDAINSAADDSAPHLSTDSNFLTFQSSRDEKMQFYECRKAGGDHRFGAPQLVPGIRVNWAMTPWITPDRRTLIYGSPNGPDHKGSTQDLYLCQRADPTSPWDPPVNLQTVNSHTHDQSPCLTSDGLTLYFGSLRRGGFGGHDLWKASRKSRDSPFTDVTNLGPAINTLIQDRDMHLAADDRTLLFVRMFGESPLLGSVLHVAVPDDRGNWQAWPVPLPVKGMITDPCVSPDGGILWFSWEGPFGEGGRDLWQIARVPIEADDVPVSHPALASRHVPFENSLGMRFLPVPIRGGPTDHQRVLFSVWETRVSDLVEFTDETGRERPPCGFDQDASHPAAMVSWDDAQAFCEWLTERERRTGRIPADWHYRLPSDHEWSCAAGIGAKEDPLAAAATKGKGPWNWYFWGESWPPPDGIANYTGEEARSLLGDPVLDNLAWVINDYRDPFVHTAPVGSFSANPGGLYDLSGNLWEWCEDWFDQPRNRRVLRGHSFLCNNGAGAKLSARGNAPPDERQPIFGLRVVLAATPE